MCFRYAIYIKGSWAIKTVVQCRETQRFVNNYVFMRWYAHIIIT